MQESPMFNKERYNKINKISTISEYGFFLSALAYIILYIACPISILINIVLVIEAISGALLGSTTIWLNYYKDEIDSLKEK